MVKRGDIFYVYKAGLTVGSEQVAGRPALVVSNNKNNEHCSVVEVVYLTTQPKTDLPTHVTIRSSKQNSIALCEHVNFISVDRLGDYISSITTMEQREVDIALQISLGIEDPAVEAPLLAPIVETKGDVQAEIERDLYKNLYEQLLDRMIGR